MARTLPAAVRKPEKQSADEAASRSSSATAYPKEALVRSGGQVVELGPQRKLPPGTGRRLPESGWAKNVRQRTASGQVDSRSGAFVSFPSGCSWRSPKAIRVVSPTQGAPSTVWGSQEAQKQRGHGTRRASQRPEQAGSCFEHLKTIVGKAKFRDIRRLATTLTLIVWA